MSVITIRLDEELENLLNQEIQLADKSRSDLVREALEQYLAYRNQERLRQSIVLEMKNLPADVRQEGLAVAEDFLPYGDEAASGQASQEKGSPWWK